MWISSAVSAAGRAADHSRKPRRRRLLALALLLLPACGGLPSGRGDRDSSQRQTLLHQGVERSYLVRVPALSRPGRPLPLVVVLHGGGGNALNAEMMTGFTELGQSGGFIVVYPEGSGRTRLLTWNAGHCCGYAMENDIDDTGFIDALIDRLLTQYAVDPARIYVTGMSNGAMMSHRLGIALSHRLAAIAPVVGAVFGDEARPQEPVSAIIINGMLDRSVPYAGGPPGGRMAGAWDGTPTLRALDQATFWAAAGACSEIPSIQDQGNYLRHSYDCPAGRAVEIYSIEDNGHAWPGGQRGSRRADAPSTSLDATKVIWQFFQDHPRP